MQRNGHLELLIFYLDHDRTGYKKHEKKSMEPYPADPDSISHIIKYDRPQMKKANELNNTNVLTIAALTAKVELETVSILNAHPTEPRQIVG